jgi:outer membrane protein assembly factor BamA
VCYLNIHFCKAQNKYILTLYTNNQEALHKIGFENSYPDSLAAIKQIRQILVQLHNKAYIQASVDSIRIQHHAVKAFFTIGEQFRWAKLKPGNLEEGMLSSIGYREKLYQNRLFSFQQVAQLEEQILRYADNRGYPFATIRLDSIQVNQQHFSASLHYEKGPYFIFDTLLLKGTARLNQRFLSAYLRMLPGQPFSQWKVDRAEKLLRQLPYISVIEPSAVTFKNERVYPHFFLDAKRTNEIDGIIGFLPNEQDENKLLITGEFNLQLRNMFSSGKNVLFKWQQIRQASPRLDIAYEHPAFLNTPLSIETSFNLLKEDTTFLSVNRQLSLSYLLNNTGKISFISGLRTSRLGKNAQYKDETQLPVYADLKLLLYGIGYKWSNLDSYFYPTRGFDLDIQAMAGNKRIGKNPFINQELYENIALNSAQFSINSVIKKYFTLFERSVLFAQISGGKVVNSQLFLNDLFRVGGLNSLRGYNENHFFASDFVLSKVEYRYFLDTTSYMFLFYDQAYVKYSLRNTHFEDTPLGTGLGVSFSTNTGIFNLIYAIGHSNDRRFGLNYSRIHFGFTSRF